MALIILPVTLVTAGGAALINAWLALRVGLGRRAAAVSIGDGGNLALATRMRAQANFVENAPFIVILIGLIEFAQGSSIWLWVVSDLPDRARPARAGDGRAAPRPAGGCGGDDAVDRGARCLCGATTVTRTAAPTARTPDRITAQGQARTAVSPTTGS